MKNIILCALLLIAMSAQKSDAIPFRACGTFVQEVECSWFESGGERFKLSLPDTLGFPSGTSEYYIEGDVRYFCFEQWCPFNSVPHCIDVTAIIACDSLCVNQLPGEINNVEGINMTDVIYFTGFLTGKFPSRGVPLSNYDVTGNCIIDENDIDHLLSFVTGGGTPPVDCTCLSPDTCSFQTAGDFNSDGLIDNVDIIFLTDFLLNGGPYPSFLANADVDGDCDIDLNDIEYLKSFINFNGPPLTDCTCISPDTCSFQTPGDLNHDSNIDVSDIVFLSNFLSGYGPAPVILANADVNGDCIVDFTDLTYLESFISSGGTAPVDCTCLSPEICSFQLPGDVNNDSFINVDDIAYLSSFLSETGEPPPILANADPNGDCIIDNTDIQYLNDFLFSGGTPPVDCTCISPVHCLTMLPGDFNSDGAYTITDIVFFTEYLIGNGPAPNPLANADANGDCIINIGDSKLINDFLFLGGPPPVDCTCNAPEFLTVCCWEFRGNVNYDPVDAIDISDLVMLIDYMFKNGTPSLCFDEANINGASSIDISDLVTLVVYMFSDVGGAPPAPCQ